MEEGLTEWLSGHKCVPSMFIPDLVHLVHRLVSLKEF